MTHVTTDAEFALMGGVLAEGAAELARVRVSLAAADIGDLAARAVFTAACSEADAGRDVTLIGVAGALERAGALEFIGGPDSLRAMEQRARPGERDALVSRVTSSARVRRAQGRAAKLAQLGSDPAMHDDPDRYLAAVAAVGHDAQTSLRRGASSASSGVGAALTAYMARGRAVRAAPTGHAGLNDLLDGGYQPGRLYVLAARPAVGKSSLMTQGLASGGQRGHPSMVFSLEMSEAQLWGRAICQVAQLPGRDWQRGKLGRSDLLRAFEKAKLLATTPVEIDCETRMVGAMMARARVWLETTARPLIDADTSVMLDDGAQVSSLVPTVWVDYLQRASIEGKFESREERVGAITDRLARFARAERCAVVLVANLNRASKKDSRPPRMDDLRESGSIEQDADTIVLLHRDAGAKHDESGSKTEQDAVIIVDKNREGEVGIVPATWHAPTMRYLDRQHPEHYYPVPEHAEH